MVDGAGSWRSSSQETADGVQSCIGGLPCDHRDRFELPPLAQLTPLRLDRTLTCLPLPPFFTSHSLPAAHPAVWTDEAWLKEHGTDAVGGAPPAENGEEGDSAPMES